MTERYLKSFIQGDLKDKIVLIGGPRQVGKTTLALTFLDPPLKNNESYFNWDADSDRPKIRNAEFPSGSKVIVLDEIQLDLLPRRVKTLQPADLLFQIFDEGVVALSAGDFLKLCQLCL